MIIIRKKKKASQIGAKILYLANKILEKSWLWMEDLSQPSPTATKGGHGTKLLPPTNFIGLVGRLVA